MFPAQGAALLRNRIDAFGVLRGPARIKLTGRAKRTITLPGGGGNGADPICPKAFTQEKRKRIDGALTPDSSVTSQAVNCNFRVLFAVRRSFPTAARLPWAPEPVASRMHRGNVQRPLAQLSSGLSQVDADLALICRIAFPLYKA